MTHLKHLIFLTILLVTACSDDDAGLSIEHQPLPLTGKVPIQVLNFGAVFSADVVDYSYLNCGLKYYDSYRYEYDENSRVKRIYLTSSRYEEYTYDGEQVISSAQYRKDSEEEGFIQRVGYSYVYENGVLSVIENVFNEESTLVIYDESGENVDSTKTYNADGALIQLSTFEYDSMQHMQTNLPKVKFGKRLQGRWNLNNVTRSDTRLFGDRPNHFQTTYRYKYEDGYPVVVYPRGASFLADSIHISYRECP